MDAKGDVMKPMEYTVGDKSDDVRDFLHILAMDNCNRIDANVTRMKIEDTLAASILGHAGIVQGKVANNEFYCVATSLLYRMFIYRSGPTWFMIVVRGK